MNAALGTILWETYAMTSSALEPSLDSHSYPTITAALSGAVAGGMQALIAAPAENVRRALTGSGWVGAWKDVFRRVPGSPTDSHSQRENVRQLRNWMAEVRGMAGRGWDGWGWGCAKDMLGMLHIEVSFHCVLTFLSGFATFFAIFDVTRRLATKTKLASQDVVETWTLEETPTRSLKRHLPRTVHGITLVSGGVVAGLAYELVNRPFDAARKAVQQHGVIDASNSPVQAVLLKFRQDGLGSFFRNLDKTEASPGSATSRRLHAALRTLARVGPWGVGFLVWEAFGPGLA